MALLSCSFFAESLGMATTATVLLPQSGAGQIGIDGGSDSSRSDGSGPPPLLYLLHGLSDDHTAWTRYTSLERYAAETGLAVVMPAVAQSFYADEAHGHAYWQFVSEELPEVVHSFFRVTDDPARTFVAGLSMGGYGALKLALTHPDRFGAAASLSGAVDVRALGDRAERAGLFRRVFGDRGVGPGDDLEALLDAAAAVPPLYVGCGTDEPLLPANERLVARARARGADVTTDFRPGEHEWGLWDAQLPAVLAWLPRGGTGAGAGS
jgi:putative tributyrin esterase